MKRKKKKKIEFLHREYGVHLLKPDDVRLSGDLGRVNLSSEIIYIANSGTLTDRVDTLFHEVLEAIRLELRLWGSGSDSEALVVRLTAGLLEVLRRNFPAAWNELEQFVRELEVEDEARHA